MKKIRLAMIGAGTHSTNALYPCLNFIDNIERVAVCDIKEGLAKEIAVKFGFSKNYTDYRKMLETENIDGVIVCINAKEHPAITKECLKQGVDVFVEKPAAISPAECKDIVDLSKKTGKFVMVDHQKRRATVYLKMKEIISKKEFGD
ncbi:MAG: Gfo/Idh/MocA family oxidoreductase, partial [Clostridiaceae bacterium]|nr:Gfo/Idh/MocA family oxidoreductase [Clostridiaceae bacterium]